MDSERTFSTEHKLRRALCLGHNIDRGMYQCAFVGVYKGVHELRGFWVAGRALELHERSNTSEVWPDPTF